MTSFWGADAQTCEHKILRQRAAAALHTLPQSVLAVWEHVPQSACHQLSEPQRCMLATQMSKALCKSRKCRPGRLSLQPPVMSCWKAGLQSLLPDNEYLRLDLKLAPLLNDFLHACVDELIEGVQLLPHQPLIGKEGRDHSPGVLQQAEVRVAQEQGVLARVPQGFAAGHCSCSKC